MSDQTSLEQVGLKTLQMSYVFQRGPKAGLGKPSNEKKLKVFFLPNEGGRTLHED